MTVKRNYHIKTVFIFFIFFVFSKILSGQIHPLVNAHSHNDYKQKYPLTTALNNGFLSIEADIFLIKKRLIVSHTYPIFKKRRTIEDLYLKPLYDSVIKHQGHIYKNSDSTLILLIELKSEGSNTYAELDKLLYKYRTILTKCENGEITKGAITVVITGHKPYKELLQQNIRYAFIDQSLLSLNDSISNFVCPLASTKYSNILNWKGSGSIPENEKQKLISLVNTAHAQKKKVRLWASPENKIVWKELLDCGVDLINTNELEKLKDFLTESGK